MATEKTSEGIKQVFKVGPDDENWTTYVFSTDQIPPRFAVVAATAATNSDSVYTYAHGPYDKEQADVRIRLLKASLQDSPLSEADMIINERRFGYEIDAGELSVEGSYPGGPERAAQNLAAFVLAVNTNEAPNQEGK